MEKNKKESSVEIIEIIKELPEKEQNAIVWTIKNFKFVRKMCENPGMTKDEIKKYKEDAIAKEDYLMLILLCAAETFNKESNETEKQ